jgi:hypothetical protein
LSSIITLFLTVLFTIDFVLIPSLFMPFL